MNPRYSASIRNSVHFSTSLATIGNVREALKPLPAQPPIPVDYKSSRRVGKLNHYRPTTILDSPSILGLTTRPSVTCDGGASFERSGAQDVGEYRRARRSATYRHFRHRRNESLVRRPGADVNLIPGAERALFPDPSLRLMRSPMTKMKQCL